MKYYKYIELQYTPIHLQPVIIMLEYFNSSNVIM